MAKLTHTTAPTAVSLLNEAQIVLTNLQNRLYPALDIYVTKWHILNAMLYCQWHSNTKLEEVYLKADTLNRYYSTNIWNILSMATGIIHIPNIDQRLQSGDPTLVNDIATSVPNRFNYSFATKYCACHNPQAYPIYDNLVADFFSEVIKKGNLSCPTLSGLSVPQIRNKMKTDYAFYKTVYAAFMQQYNLTSLSYREVDWYIWTAGKLLKGLQPAPTKNRSSVNVWTTAKSQMHLLPQFSQLLQLV